MVIDGSTIFLFGARDVIVGPALYHRGEPDNKTSSRMVVTITCEDESIHIPMADFEQFIAALNTAHAVCQRYERDGLPKDLQRLVTLFREQNSDDDDDDKTSVTADLDDDE
jgi:hypothetical protein